jgi:glutamate synthase (NADPH/NADH) large chain
LLERHAAETGSPVAAGLLARWPAAAGEFTAVVPGAWRRAMAAIRAAEATGADVDAAVMAAAGVSGA